MTASNNNAPGKIRSALRVPEALWVGLVLSALAGAGSVALSWSAAKERAAILETQAQADRDAWQARAARLEAELAAVAARNKERLLDARRDRAEALDKLAAAVEANATRLERCLSLLAQRGPQIGALEGLPDRLRDVEARLGVAEFRLDNARPGQGIPPPPK